MFYFLLFQNSVYPNYSVKCILSLHFNSCFRRLSVGVGQTLRKNDSWYSTYLWLSWYLQYYIYESCYSREDGSIQKRK